MDNKIQRNFFIKFFLSCIAIEIYFISTFLVSNELSTKMGSYLNEINATNKAEPHFNYIYNILRH